VLVAAAVVHVVVAVSLNFYLFFSFFFIVYFYGEKADQKAACMEKFWRTFRV